MFLLSEASGKDVDVVIVRILVDLIEDDDTGAQAVFSLRTVGAAFDDRPGLDAGDLFLCPVIELLDLLRNGRNFEESDQILRWPDCLFLVVRADIHVIFAYPVIRAGQEEALCGDRAVFPCSSSQHAEQIRPPRLSCVIPVRTVMQGDREPLPWKELKRQIGVTQVHVFRKLVLVNVDRFCLKAVPDMLNQQFLLFTAAEFFLLDNIDPFLYLRREPTARHRLPLSLCPALFRACRGV